MSRAFLCIILVLCTTLLTACSSNSAMQPMKSDSTMMMSMPMNTAHNHDTDNAIAHFSVQASSKSLLANQDATIKILIQNKRSQPIVSFDRLHEKLLHLIVVSKDLAYFNHIHPEYKGAGLFEITTQFPADGEYKLYADYMPTGIPEIVQAHWVTVADTSARPIVLVPDKQLFRIVDDIEVSLSFDHLMAGMDLAMTFTINDAKTKKPITHLQPYLGAIGHVVAIRADTKQFLHFHPTDNSGSGPTAKFQTNFPTKGIYKIWAQFQQHDQLYTIPFIIEVP
ncbi:hypothetical protein EHS13_31500 [Paenibacillus psychroresistens]|uniref:YtkA-like domain-containing protein n=1 Tax=Paenibacillus psychroresistens TaxID=1778678 RepID=A0A6B8RUF8_9BACL|nr:hypothetical protein [Paenibacillus psychroresistens]QGQ99083.1 hypothetical protein EHS13_31500 [Paenibacillus psychroresistens]